MYCDLPQECQGKLLFCLESNLKFFLGMSPHSIHANWLNVSITQSFHTSLCQAVPYSWSASSFRLPSYRSSIIQTAHAIPPPPHGLPELLGKGLVAPSTPPGVSISHLRLSHSSASALNLEMDIKCLQYKLSSALFSSFCFLPLSLLSLNSDILSHSFLLTDST